MATRGQARELLLEAAVALFAERGYDRTTTRDVAERAGVDAALIARYYGGKDGLYLAALREETGDAEPPDLLHRDRTASLLARVDARGAGPVLRAAVERHPDDAVRTASVAALSSRLVEPLAARLRDEGVQDAQLAAELRVAAFAGVLLGRGAGAFPALSDADADVLTDLLLDLIGG